MNTFPSLRWEQLIIIRLSQIEKLVKFKNDNSGEIFTIATWEQVDDKHWYRGHINSGLICIEMVSVLSSLEGSLLFEYKVIKGYEPNDVIGQTLDQQGRISFILNQKPSVFP